MSDERQLGSADHALLLLQLVARDRIVRVAEAARHLDVARSTAHRLLQVLQAHGFVEQDPETRAYGIGPELVATAVTVGRGLDLRSVAGPVMEELTEELAETTHLSVLRGSEIVIIESFETSRALRIGSRIGLIRPAYATAAGRVLLAWLDQGVLQDHLPAKLERLTPRTVATRRELDDILAQVRTNEYAVSVGESEEEVASVAAPVRMLGGRVVAALAISAPPPRLAAYDLAAVAAALRASAARIATAIP